MLMKKPKHRIFEYTPRFYKPEKDEIERLKRRLGFSAKRKALKRKRSPIVWLVLIFAILYLYLKLAKLI